MQLYKFENEDLEESVSQTNGISDKLYFEQTVSGKKRS